MNKKGKGMSNRKDWKTVGIEGPLLAKLREEAERHRRSAQEMLCIILEERYRIPK